MSGYSMGTQLAAGDNAEANYTMPNSLFFRRFRRGNNGTHYV